MYWWFICKLRRTGLFCFCQTCFWLFRLSFLYVYLNFQILFLLRSLFHFLTLLFFMCALSIFIGLCLMNWLSCLTVLFRFFLLILLLDFLWLWLGRENIPYPWKKVSDEPRLILLVNFLKQIRVELGLKKLI